MGPAGITWGTMCFSINKALFLAEEGAKSHVVLSTLDEVMGYLVPLGKRIIWVVTVKENERISCTEPAAVLPVSPASPAMPRGPCLSDRRSREEVRWGKATLRITGRLWWTTQHSGESCWLLEMKQISRSRRRWQRRAEKITAAKAQNKSVPHSDREYRTRERSAPAISLEGEKDSLRNNLMGRILKETKT